LRWWVQVGALVWALLRAQNAPGWQNHTPAHGCDGLDAYQQAIWSGGRMGW